LNKWNYNCSIPVVKKFSWRKLWFCENKIDFSRKYSSIKIKKQLKTHLVPTKYFNRNLLSAIDKHCLQIPALHITELAHFFVQEIPEHCVIWNTWILCYLCYHHLDMSTKDLNLKKRKLFLQKCLRVTWLLIPKSSKFSIGAYRLLKTSSTCTSGSVNKPLWKIATVTRPAWSQSNTNHCCHRRGLSAWYSHWNVFA